MDDHDYKSSLDNEKEWRTHIFVKLTRLEEKQDKILARVTGLEKKNFIIALIVGSLGSHIPDWARGFLK